MLQARLKLDRRTSSRRREFMIAHLLKLLGLNGCAHLRIGSSGDKVK